MRFRYIYLGNCIDVEGLVFIAELLVFTILLVIYMYLLDMLFFLRNFCTLLIFTIS